MLNAVFKRGREAASGIDYGTSDTNHKGERRSVAPRVLYGDPEHVKAVVRTMDCAQRYTSGVLAFAERSLPEKLKAQIIEEHLRISFPGLDPTRVAAVYIEHADEGFCEIHYWIANLDLVSGKRINAYFHRVDRRRLQAMGAERERPLQAGRSK